MGHFLLFSKYKQKLSFCHTFWPLEKIKKEEFNRENEAVKHDLVEFKVQCLNVFCYHGNNILLFNLIFRTTPEVSTKFYSVEIR